MIRMMSIATLVLSMLMISVAVQEDIPRVLRGQSPFVTQEAHDAVQDQRLGVLERVQTAAVETQEVMRDKLNWIVGGIGGFGALVTFLNIAQIFIMRKKP